MADIETRVVANYQTAEYGKFVELTNNTAFPAVSVTRYNSPNVAGRAPLSSVEVYPKYAVITYDARLGIANALPFGDNSTIDAFGRLRVSNPQTVFDSKVITGKSPYTYDEALSGTGRSTFMTGDSYVSLSTSAVNDFVIRQTFTHFNYQPGKSTTVFCTGMFRPQTNIIKRVGLFQGLSAIPYLPDDGIYLESSNNTISFNIKKGQGVTSLLSAAQADWNVDKLDGNGPSGLTIDFTKAQILTFDYEWLGLGRVRCGFVLNGKIYHAHHFNNFNTLSAPYMTSPDHPVRYEIRQTGAGSGELRQICSSVMVEGGEENIGASATAELSGGIGVDTTIRPLLGIRLNPSTIDSVALIKNIQVFNTGNTPVIYKLIQDPTITGGSLTNYRQVDGYTDIQFIEGSASLSLSGGYEIYSSYAPNGNASVASGAGAANIAGELARLGSKVDGTPVTYWVAGRAVTGTATSVYTVLNMVLRG